MKKKVLIAEDEKPMARAMQLKLNKSGYDAHIAENGASAIEMLQKDTYDIMLLDLVMPVKDGFEVLRTMKEEKITVPTIVSSNLSQKEDEIKTKEMGAIDFLIKSNTPITEIVKKIEHHLGA